MTSLPRRIVLTALVALAATGARAFTDTNAELKTVAADRAGRVIVVGKSAPSVHTVWVPPTAKSLDGFRPVFADERAAARDLQLAQADAKEAKKKAAAR